VVCATLAYIAVFFLSQYLLRRTALTEETAKMIDLPPLLDDDDPALLPKLTEAQVQMLSRYGEMRRICF
jgi:hypothetical protein